MPKRPSPQPGCPELVDKGWCPKHQPKRLSPSKRGYDRDWLRVRDAFARDNPRICNWPGCGITLADKVMHVDHIEPFKGLDDPKRLDVSNLQWLCKPHHDRKTQEDKRRNLILSARKTEECQQLLTRDRR